MKLKITKFMALALIATFSIGAIIAKAEEGSIKASASLMRAQIEKNKEIRNERVDINKEKKAELKDLRASTTGMVKNLRGEYRDDRDELRASSTMPRRDIRASSTEMFKKFQENRQELMNKMKRDAFQVRKDALIKQLNLSIDNLTNIRVRINDRIIKLEGEGKVMTSSKTALATADDKLAKAKVAVNLFASTNFATSTASTTIDIDLGKPRQIGDSAIKAVKEARDSFKVVIQTIVDALGFGKGWENATTTTPVATTTATTTSI